MKLKITIASWLLLVAFSTQSARADVQVGNMSVPASIADPLSGFSITYSLFGSKFGVGAASAQLSFYLSTTADGSSGVFPLFSQQLLLNGTGLGPYLPPPGSQSAFISRFSMPANTVTVLQSLCAPRTLFILGQVDATPVASTSSSLGSVVPPDFAFTTGTLSPATIHPGGTVTISFSMFTQCPANAPSRVGIFLADASFNLLSFIGAVSVSTGAGTFSLPPTGITFSPTIPTGNYNIVVIADVDGVIAESNENNNAGAFAFSVTAGASPIDRGPSKLEPDPDLAVDASELRDLESRGPDGVAKF